MSNSGTVFRDKTHKRMRNEKYYTPPWVTRCLLRRVELRGGVLEPAAGDGQIVRSLEAAGYYVTASDIAPDRPEFTKTNFLDLHSTPRQSIVTNPPFGVGGRLAVRFCKHALRLAEREHGMVAMLLRDDFDSAGGRRSLFRDHPAFDRKVVITDRIRWTNLPQKEAGPSGSHAWFIWDWARDPDQWPIVQYESADVNLKDPEARLK